MSQLMDEKVRTQIRAIFAQLAAPVKLVFFTQEHACGPCREQQELLEDVAALSDKLSLEVHDLVTDAELARQYGIDKVPATAVVGKEDHGIRFFGVTGGYEFASLLEDIQMASRGESGLGPELERLVRLIDQPVRLEVMVTLTCPYCPKMAQVAHQLAFANDLIRAEVVNSAEFPQLVQRYDVHGVPKTVINGRPAFEGALPAPQAILEILKLVKPREYEELEAALREAKGERQVTKADPEHEYDLIIVGAGAATWTAAIYAARKNLDVALLGDRPGGQIMDTATIENWPGAPEIGGQELAEAFRRHAEHYPIAESLHVKVVSVEKTAGGFRVKTSDGKTWRARSVIYAAGKQYRRLGAPGEDRFLGHGIAFCATCDAPLYRDKRVAVVGGGNSAFTAARDLIHYAREIHIINILPNFQADPALQEEVKKSPHAHLHPAMHVREYLGKERLTGVRLESTDGTARLDLPVDGVFLEIGLVPNSEPVKHLLELNATGEIPVGRDQSTKVPGLFAAGDVTDEPEKQIITAAAAGAKAALAAYSYLSGHNSLQKQRGSEGGKPNAFPRA
jgi:alkyl hydroperoxide reductase subunit F